MGNTFIRMLDRCLSVLIAVIFILFGMLTSELSFNVSAVEVKTFREYCYIPGTGRYETVTLSYYIENDEAVIYSNTNSSNAESVFIPNTLDGYPVTKISDSAFKSSRYKTIRLPDTLKTIDDEAFIYSSYLKFINLPEGLESIGKMAFYQCVSLDVISVPDSVSSIGELALGYAYNSSTKNAEFRIEAFDLCTDNNYAKTYADDNNIPVYPFNTRELYSEGKCGDSVSYKLYPDHTIVLSGSGSTHGFSTNGINNMVLGIPNSLCLCFDKIILEEGITSLGESFLHGAYITELVLPDSMETLGKNVLHNAVKLKKLHIGKGLKSIDTSSSMVMSYCRLEEISVDEENAFFFANNNGLYDKSKTILIKYCSGADIDFSLPKTVTKIGPDSVSSNYNITKAEIPEGVKEIGCYAFDDCPNLTEIYFPKSVKSIDPDMCGNCFDSSTYKDYFKNDIVFYGYSGTVAESYAAQNGFDFISLGAAVRGDVDKDGKLTMKDYAMLLQYLNGWDVVIDDNAADINGDGSVKMKDYALLLQLLNGWDV